MFCKGQRHRVDDEQPSTDEAHVTDKWRGRDRLILRVTHEQSRREEGHGAVIMIKTIFQQY